MSRLIGILVFDGVDLLDVGGPYEVFLTASRLAVRDGGEPPFEVMTVSVDGAAKTAYGGLVLQPERSVEGFVCDVFVVPGLVDLGRALDDDELNMAMREAGGAAGILSSVCTGAVLLANAGLLAGTVATTHFEDVGLLANLIGSDNVVTERWVDAGEVVTAGGLSNGIAMAFHLVDRLESRELAQRTALQLDYEWDPIDGLIVD